MALIGTRRAITLSKGVVLRRYLFLFGDSLEAQNGYFSSSVGSEEYSCRSRGGVTLSRLLSPMGIFDNWYDATATGQGWRGANQGFSGDQTSDAVARLSTLTAMLNTVGGKNAVVMVGLGTNDINAATALATIQANLTTIYNAILATGANIVIMPPPPRAMSGTNSWASGSVARLKWLSLCPWMQSVADANPSRIRIERRDLLLSNPDADRSPITSPLSVLDADNVHRNVYGAYIEATDPAGINAQLAGWMAPFTDFPAYPVAGELFPNPLLTGTGGSKGSGVSGNVANSCAVAVSGTGVSCVASKDTDDTQVLTITSLGTGSNSDQCRFGINSATIAPPADGTWLQASARLSFDATTILCGPPSVLGRGQPSGSNMYAYAAKHDSPYNWPNVGLPEHWQQGPKFQTRSGTTGLIDQVYVPIDGTKAGTAVVRVKRMHLPPVSEPKSQYGL